ncbi:hypothetical protein Atc_0903 [Acidithiobacillus caldus SM-1]|uniref:Uncharacterized protein n=1 Tax=Acidithiobacillus caldus (strain SM-1) TaxID=990288 RepID=F9ZL24_ACICS|nr:hypothetical protein Atc_0903 [Acidithiobacillus caldus SM-1]
MIVSKGWMVKVKRFFDVSCG